MRRIFAILLILVSALGAPQAAAQADPDVKARLEAWFAAYDARPPNPASITVTVDRAKQVTATIGVKGGTLKLETPEALYELEIPEGAFLYPVEVTMAPLTGVEGLGPEVTSVLGVRLGPDGMELWDSAWLSVRPTAGGTMSGFFPFAFFGDGANAHYGNFVRAEDGSIFLQVTHFSGFGAALGGVTSQVLNQAKPDAEKFGGDYGDPLRSMWGGAADALGGGTNVKQGGETIEDVINRTIAESWKTGGAAGKRLGGKWPASGTDCDLAIDGALSFVNGRNDAIDQARRKNPKSDAAKADKIELAPAYWRQILACAKPPIAVCFNTGNPKPLVAFLKRIKAYRPSTPDEQVRMGAVLEWLDENLKACAAYETRIDTDTNVAVDPVEWQAALYFEIPFKLKLGTDSIVASGKAEVLASRFECAAGDMKCSVTGFTVDEQPKISLSLGDLPFFAPQGGLDAAAFKPKVYSGWTTLKGKVKAREGSYDMPFEVVFAAWWCHYKSELGKSGDHFEFKGWKPGTYPVLFTLSRPADGDSDTKICEDVPVKLRMLANFIHKPAGDPVPEPALKGLPPEDP